MALDPRGAPRQDSTQKRLHFFSVCKPEYAVGRVSLASQFPPFAKCLIYSTMYFYVSGEHATTSCGAAAASHHLVPTMLYHGFPLSRFHIVSCVVLTSGQFRLGPWATWVTFYT